MGRGKFARAKLHIVKAECRNMELLLEIYKDDVPVTQVTGPLDEPYGYRSELNIEAIVATLLPLLSNNSEL